MTQVHVDLDRIAAGEAGTVVLKGTTHDVQGIPATLLQLLQSAKGDDYIVTALTIIRRCVPSIPEEDLADLSVAQIEGMLAVITHDVETIAKLDPNYTPPDPNAKGPATDQTSPA